jgi:hypothetical protein
VCRQFTIELGLQSHAFGIEPSHIRIIAHGGWYAIATAHPVRAIGGDPLLLLGAQAVPPVFDFLRTGVGVEGKVSAGGGLIGVAEAVGADVARVGGP